MAWPARPQDTYGLEKLYAEEMCLAYAKDFPIKTRMARYHNVYGPRGTWKGTSMSSTCLVFPPFHFSKTCQNGASPCDIYISNT